jgi:hypothetical protein
MVKEGKTYRKLCGRSTMSVQSAHLSDDHLLVVDGQYSEVCKRLYYKDIEAILICPTKSGGVMALLLLLAGIPMMLSFPLGGADYVPLFVFGAIFSIIGTFVLFGKGSVLFGVKTAVQTVVLTGINTRRKAAKAEAKLVVEIEKAQGALSIEDLHRVLYKDAGSYGSLVGGGAKKAEAPAGPPPIAKTQGGGPPLGV